MESFMSFIERTVQVRLQHFTRFRVPIPPFVAFAVLPSLQIIRRTSSASISALATALRNTHTSPGALGGIPLATSLFNIFAHAVNTACLRAGIRVKMPIQWRDMFIRSRGQTRSDGTKYATPRAEAKYWRVSARYRRRLYSGNVGAVPTPPTPPTPLTASREDIPLVTYYTPRLLPLYRDRSGSGRDRALQEADSADPAQFGRISARTFCKWHRMVFQDSLHHPTLAEAAVQMKYYSHRDLREIQRIARMLPDELVFDPQVKRGRRSRRSTKYNDIWQNWLENKGVDLVIVFE